MTESALDTWRIDEIKETLRAYGFVVIYEDVYQVNATQRYACRIRKGDIATGTEITGRGVSRFDALLDAYKRAGLSVYK